MTVNRVEQETIEFEAVLPFCIISFNLPISKNHLGFVSPKKKKKPLSGASALFTNEQSYIDKDDAQQPLPPLRTQIFNIDNSDR